MKKEWSPDWQTSLQPRKQRKFRFNAPLHTRQSFARAMLSPELRKRFGKRSMQVRKGDEIRVMRGNLKGKTGTVERVDLGKSRIFVEEFKIKKVDGSEIHKPLEPSNIMITKMKLEDKKRQAILARVEEAKKPKAAMQASPNADEPKPPKAQPATQATNPAPDKPAKKPAKPKAASPKKAKTAKKPAKTAKKGAKPKK